MTDTLLATRILNAAQAILGPLTRQQREDILAEQPEFSKRPHAVVMQLAAIRP